MKFRMKLFVLVVIVVAASWPIRYAQGAGSVDQISVSSQGKSGCIMAVSAEVFNQDDDPNRGRLEGSTDCVGADLYLCP